MLRVARRLSASSGYWCRNSQMSSPVAASSAWTTFPGLARNITPSCTSGAVWLVPSGIARAQASRRPATLSGPIWSSGVWPWLSRVRRQVSQSSAGGFRSSSSVTGVKSETSRLTKARSGGTASTSRGSSAAAASDAAAADASAATGALAAGTAPGSPMMAPASAVSACGPAACPFSRSR